MPHTVTVVLPDRFDELMRNAGADPQERADAREQFVRSQVYAMLHEKHWHELAEEFKELNERMRTR